MKTTDMGVGQLIKTLITLSLFLMVLGAVEMLIQGQSPVSGFSCPQDILFGVLSFNSLATFQLSVLILIETPFLVAGYVLLKSVYDKDVKMVVISAGVLALLTSAYFMS